MLLSVDLEAAQPTDDMTLGDKVAQINNDDDFRHDILQELSKVPPQREIKYKQHPVSFTTNFLSKFN